MPVIKFDQQISFARLTKGTRFKLQPYKPKHLIKTGQNEAKLEEPMAPAQKIPAVYFNVWITADSLAQLIEFEEQHGIQSPER